MCRVQSIRKREEHVTGGSPSCPFCHPPVRERPVSRGQSEGRVCVQLHTTHDIPCDHPHTDISLVTICVCSPKTMASILKTCMYTSGVGAVSLELSTLATRPPSGAPVPGRCAFVIRSVSTKNPSSCAHHCCCLPFHRTRQRSNCLPAAPAFLVLHQRFGSCV